MRLNLCNLKFPNCPCFLLLLFNLQLLQAESEDSFCSIDDNGTQHCSPSGSSRYSEPEQLSASQGHQPVTGLEFIPDNFQLKIDEDFYIGENAFSTKRFLKLSPVKLVRMFIRELKGLPRDTLIDSHIGSKKDESGRKKPAWSFYPYRLKKLAEIELNFYKILKSAQGLMPLLALESYLTDIEQSSMLALSQSPQLAVVDDESDPFLYIGTHPLLIYRMIRRFSEDLQPILSKLLEKQDLITAIYEANPDLEIFPTTEDLEDALESLERIQANSNLKTEEFASGILETLDTGIGLDALHTLEVGAFCIVQEKYDYAIQWIFLAQEKVSRSPKALKFPVIGKFIQKMLEYAINQHNKHWDKKHAYKWAPGVFNTKVNSTDIPSYQRMFDVQKETSAAISERSKSFWNWNIPVNFAQVCSGVNLQTSEEKRLLNCFYFQFVHPYWYINPLKMELLNADPPVVQVYEFFGEKCIKDIKKAAIGGLARSLVVDRSNHFQSKVDKVRTSSQVWLYDKHQHSGNFLLPLSRKLELLTNLIVVASTSSDAYQVATYGSSHHYEPHIDSFEDPARCAEKGNRIFTIMGYLSDVTVGGRTGFPVLGTFADPIKRSLVIWENMKNDSVERDTRTFHGGCPVVLGVKWITNKWVYSKDNMFKYPCFPKE